jgi:voltage-gated potassium channel
MDTRATARQHRNSPRVAILLRYLYASNGECAGRFRYGLLLFDLTTIVFLVATSFVERSVVIEVMDFAVGLVLLADFIARLMISRRRLHDLLHPLGLADLVVIISFLAPIVGQGFGFLRVLRMLRLFRSYRTVQRMKRDFPFVRRNYDACVAAVHLFVFLFVMTALVYVTQYGSNPAIGNYADALYFTVATLTTTGFGDITLPGITGRMLSVFIMLVGISLFLRLIQVLFQPSTMHHRCVSCGLFKHDGDAVHCKRCGALLIISASEHVRGTR